MQGSIILLLPPIPPNTERKRKEMGGKMKKKGQIKEKGSKKIEKNSPAAHT